MIADAAAAMTWLAWSVVLACCAAADSMFCGLETGIYVLNKIRLELNAEKGSRPARALRRMLERPNNLLAVLLIGTNLCRYVATFSITTMFVMAGAGGEAEWYTLAVATPLLFVVGDSVPKSVFQRVAERAVYRLVWLLRASGIAFQVTGLLPLVRGLSWLLLRAAGVRKGIPPPLGHQGLAAVVAEGHATGLLTHSQSIMADRVMHIAEVELADAMTPMARVVSAGTDITRPQLVQLAREHSCSRLPLLNEAGRVVGILNIDDVLIADDDVPPAARATAPLVLPTGMNVIDALYRMQRAHEAMSVVEGGAGRHVGIVTVKDLVEEIVGEMQAW